MRLDELLIFCQEKIKQFPNLEEDIMDVYQLASDEIEEGSSEYNECQIAESEILDMIKDETS
jgi:hypothetical protein